MKIQRNDVKKCREGLSNILRVLDESQALTPFGLKNQEALVIAISILDKLIAGTLIDKD